MSKMVYKRVRACPFGRSLPVQDLLGVPPGGRLSVGMSPCRGGGEKGGFRGRATNVD